MGKRNRNPTVMALLEQGALLRLKQNWYFYHRVPSDADFFNEIVIDVGTVFMYVRPQAQSKRWFEFICDQGVVSAMLTGQEFDNIFEFLK